MKFLKLLKKNKTVEPATYDAVYGSMVEKKIRLRYSLSAELAILRQRDKKPEEFAQFNAYVEQCKAEVKKELEVND
jgi:hypothetical protein